MIIFYKSTRYFLPLVIVGLAGCCKEPKFETPKFHDLMARMKPCAKGENEQKFDLALKASAVKFTAEVVY